MKKRLKYDVIREAADILGLSERATMKTIKSSYKELMKQWHPDVCGKKNEKCKIMTQRINRAYKIILHYCHNYPYSFAKEAVNATLSPDEWLFERFGEDPLWSGKKGKDSDE
jgi:hypothetical protein